MNTFPEDFHSKNTTRLQCIRHVH